MKPQAVQPKTGTVPNNSSYYAGRPTRYTQELLDVANEYIENYAEHGHKIPSIAGLALVLETNRETLHRWAKDKNKAALSHILQRLSLTQEQNLLSNGLDGTFNPAITKLVLGKHGYTEHNQGDTQIQVTVSRQKVQVKSRGQTLTIDTDQGTERPVIEHKSTLEPGQDQD